MLFPLVLCESLEETAMFSLRLVLGIAPASPRASCGLTRILPHLLQTTNSRHLATDTENNNPSGVGSSLAQEAAKSGGFAKAFEKQSQITDTQEIEQPKTFASLLRHSKLMDVSSTLCSIPCP